MNDVKRNLADDLALCDAATTGEWHIDVDLSFDAIFVKDGRRFTVAETYSSVNAAFIAAARTGWPDVIKRCMAAEAEVERLRDENAQIRSRMSHINAHNRLENERLRAALSKIDAVTRDETSYAGSIARLALDEVGDVR